jgi:hypothetical protein
MKFQSNGNGVKNLSVDVRTTDTHLTCKSMVLVWSAILAYFLYFVLDTIRNAKWLLVAMSAKLLQFA